MLQHFFRAKHLDVLNLNIAQFMFTENFKITDFFSLFVRAVCVQSDYTQSCEGQSIIRDSKRLFRGFGC